MVNQSNVASFLTSRDGKAWTQEVAFEVSGYNHNVADGFISLRPAIYATGQGSVVFRSLTYRAS